MKNKQKEMERLEKELLQKQAKEPKESEFERKLKPKIADAIRELEAEGEVNPGVTFYVNHQEKKKWRPKEHFIKVYDDMFELIDFYKLDAYELATIMKLMKYVEYETNLICDDKGVALNKTDLMQLLNYSENKLEEIIKSLVEKKILAKTKVGRKVIYHMSPYIAFRGQKISPETESIFR